MENIIKMDAANLRPFTSHDWDSFAGTEAPEGRGEPLIGQSDNECLMIVDKNGVEVYIGEYGEEVWRLDTNFEVGRAVALTLVMLPIAVCLTL